MDNRLAAKIDRVDARGRPIGQISRASVFEAAANFRVTHIFLFNKRRELLLQQIANGRSRHPGYWGSSVAGYLLHGETYADAARRKLSEELGIANLPLTYVGQTSMQDERSKKFIGLYTATYDGPLSPHPDDFAALWFASLRDVTRRIKKGSLSVTPTFLRVFEYYCRRRNAS